MTAWKLPLLVAAIAVPIALAFYAGGPGVGIGAGALVAVAIVFFAVRDRPRRAIGTATPASAHRRLLVVVSRPVEDSWALAEIGARVADGDGDVDVLVLAPARIGFLDRWASDLEAARHRAQQNLVITVASLAKVGISAEARVGDEDLVQAVEDTFEDYAATEVILVTAGEQADPAAGAAAAELEARLRTRFEHLVVGDSAAD